MLVWSWDTYACRQMAFKRRDLMITKIVIDNKITGQVNLFNCLGNMISCEGEFDIDKKLFFFFFENYKYFR